MGGEHVKSEAFFVRFGLRYVRFAVLRRIAYHCLRDNIITCLYYYYVLFGMSMRFLCLVLLVVVLTNGAARAQFWEGDSWYTNPLGFEPVKLHTSMGFLIPAVVVTSCLLLTSKDSSLEHKVSYYNEAGLSWGYKYPYAVLVQNSTGVNFFLRRYLSVGCEIDEYVPSDDFNHTVGFAIRPFARFYAVNQDSWKLYFESGGGFVYFLDEFPKPTDRDDRLGTQLNGTTKYGIGTYVSLNRHTDVLFGIRHVHVSNGNTKGVERNPSHDSNGFFVGVSYIP